MSSIFNNTVIQQVRVSTLLFLMLLFTACGGTSWIGTKQLGVAGVSTFGRSVATDANGNVYVASMTNGSLDGNTLTGFLDFFVTKYDSTGVKQ